MKNIKLFRYFHTPVVELDREGNNCIVFQSALYDEWIFEDTESIDNIKNKIFKWLDDHFGYALIILNGIEDGHKKISNKRHMIKKLYDISHLKIIVKD